MDLAIRGGNVISPDSPAVPKIQLIWDLADHEAEIIREDVRRSPDSGRGLGGNREKYAHVSPMFDYGRRIALERNGIAHELNFGLDYWANQIAFNCSKEDKAKAYKQCDKLLIEIIGEIFTMHDRLVAAKQEPLNVDHYSGIIGKLKSELKKLKKKYP